MGGLGTVNVDYSGPIPQMKMRWVNFSKIWIVQAIIYYYLSRNPMKLNGKY